MPAGRPPKDERLIKQALIDYLDGVAIKAICRKYGIHVTTLYDYIRKFSVPMRNKPEVFGEASS